jgi:hypothetical protein
MSEQQQPLQDLQHIKKMMERSSRFISLSGLSGIAAGVCALIGAWFAWQRLHIAQSEAYDLVRIIETNGTNILYDLFSIATYTFVGAFISAFFFTYLRSRKDNVPMFGSTTMRLLWNVAIPIVAGGIFLLHMMDQGEFLLIAPGCLIFYGLALVNGSKYTLGEIRFLGYGMLALGIMNLWFTGYGLYFWAMGFGMLHIVYGITMWMKYERNSN